MQIIDIQVLANLMQNKDLFEALMLLGFIMEYEMKNLKVISVMLKSIQYKSIYQSCILYKKYIFSLSVQFFGGNVPLCLHLFR